MPYANNKGADQPEHNISSFYIRNFKLLTSFCGCAGRFESYLVENPEDKFSHDEAHIKVIYCLRVVLLLLPVIHHAPVHVFPQRWGDTLGIRPTKKITPPPPPPCPVND